MIHKFASLQNSEIGYAVDTSLHIVATGRPLAYWAVAFYTYGDGLTQHSGSWLVQEEQFRDYCYSLAASMLSLPVKGELQASMRFHWPDKTSVAKLRFAQSVRYDAKKIRYYSMQEQRLSASDSKRHDRRWSEVPSWADGTAASMARLIRGDYLGSGVLEEYRLHLDCYDYNQATPGSPWSQRPEYVLQFSGIDHSYLEIENAFNAVARLVEAWFAFEYVETALEQYERNLKAVDEVGAQPVQVAE